MKKWLAALILLTILPFSQLFAQYCSSSFTNVTWEHITNVNYAGINNTSGGMTGGPVNYTTGTPANVTMGVANNLSVTILADMDEYVYAFIDWNQNGILNDAGEVYVVATAVATSGPHVVSITPPLTATVGSTRMRVMLDWANSTPNPCISSSFGEAEDYTVIVSAASNCSTATFPASATTQASETSICIGRSVNFSITPSSTMPSAAGITYQWQTGPTATGPWTNVGAAALTAPRAFNIGATQYYRCQVLCNGTPTTLASAPILITANNPALTSTTGATNCGPGSVVLSAVPAGTASVNWYSSLTATQPLFTGNNFTTPFLPATTTYYAAATSGASQLNNWVGTGTSSSSNPNPYYTGYDATKTQFLIRASELIALGYTAGNIQSLSFNVINVGSLPLTNFTIAMKNTTTNALTLTYETGLTTVFTSASYMPTSGFNEHVFPTPFSWDGVSNIIIETCFNNVSWGGTHTVAVTTALGFNASLYEYQDGNTNFCASPSGFKYNSTTRPNIRLKINVGCEGTRVPVVGTITTSPLVTTSFDSVLCNNGITNIALTSPASNYATYNWVYVGAATGNTLFTDALATTPYTNTSRTNLYFRTTTPGLHRIVINSNNPTSGCSSSDTFKVFVNPNQSTLSILGDKDTLCVSGVSTISLSDSTYLKAGFHTWYESDDNVNFTAFSPASMTFNTATLTNHKYYRIVVRNAANQSCDTINKTIFVNSPTLVNYSDSGRCGPGSVTLFAQASPGNSVKWYTAATGGVPVYVGDTFVSPYMSNSTTYYAEAGQLGVTTIQVGTGTSSSTSTGAGPYNRFYYNTKTQLLYTAAELAAVGGAAGLINSIAMNCTGLPDAAFTNYRVKIIAVPATQTTLTAFVPDASFTNVTTFASHMPVIGWNNYNLATPFAWNGTDNIVIQICYTSFSSYTSVGTHQYTSAPNRMFHGRADVANIDGCTNDGYFPSAASERPNMKFTFALCNSARIPIVAHVSERPDVDLGPDINRCVKAGDLEFLNARNPGLNYTWDNGYNGQVRVVDASGVYWVHVDNGLGCGGSDTVNILFKPSPISTLGNDTSVCRGTIVTLDAGNDGIQYYWNTGATTNAINVDRADTFTVAITGANGCVTLDSIIVQQSGSMPSYNAIRVRNLSVNTFNFSLLNPSNVSSISWDFGDGSPISYAMSPTHAYTSNGNYVVRMISNSSCGSKSDTTTVHIKGYTDINDIANNDAIKLYPNPAKSYVNIEMEDGTRIKQVNVLSVTGRLIKAIVDVNQAEVRLDTDDLTSGLYYITIETKDGVYKRKLDIIK